MQTAAAERMRRMRARRTGQDGRSPLIFEREDWRLLIEPRSWAQKAGCRPNQIGRVITKELVENALDSGAEHVTLEGGNRLCVVTDDGPGIASKRIPELFAVNRPLLSSKLKRMPTRGMLGHGLRVVMGAVAAYDGKISVASRRREFDLEVDVTSGRTRIADEREADVAGTRVVVSFNRIGPFKDEDFQRGRTTIAIAASPSGVTYNGSSKPAWYGIGDLAKLFAAAPQRASVADVLSDVFDLASEDARPARALTEAEIGSLALPAVDRKVIAIGSIGEEFFAGFYQKVERSVGIDRVTIPVCVEAWVTCKHVEKGEEARFQFSPIVNRGISLAELSYWSDSTGLSLHGCGLGIKMSGPKRADYEIALSIIAPYIRLTGDGKAPHLGDFAGAIEKAVRGAATEAYRNMSRPPSEGTIKDAAYVVMRNAYLEASNNGTLPAKARQIMYRARGAILRMTGKKKFDDKYFTQVLLPDYMNEHAEETAEWDVVYDTRGHLVEPHTRMSVSLGTIQVRQYLGERGPLGPAVSISSKMLYPTSGPKNRYGNVLFCEKEGFDELWQSVALAERYDIAIMSTKGMSVVAARALLDRIASEVDRVFVLHDFDLSGFSIYGTLGTDSRRYSFGNKVNIMPIGLRLADVTALDLEAEPVKVDNTTARMKKLLQHGATWEEIEFLATPDDDGMCRRVELNAMTSQQLVDLVEAKLAEHGCAKVVPENGTLEEQARRLLEAKLTKEVVEKNRKQIADQAARFEFAADLDEQVMALLAEQPSLSWDAALAEILG
jgi:hypothetical protein